MKAENPDKFIVYQFKIGNFELILVSISETNITTDVETG
jgi:hypothetical protein